jgi:hypothetical protein
MGFEIVDLPEPQANRLRKPVMAESAHNRASAERSLPAQFSRFQMVAISAAHNGQPAP